MDRQKEIVKLQWTKLNINDICELVAAPNCGAISTFIGITRNNFETKKVLKLEYEAYVPMAIKEIHKICAKLRSQWNVERIAIFHRLGEVPVTEASIVIAISSPHRQESLQAVQFAIDNIKATVPIWKKEVYEIGVPEWKENKECSWSSINTGCYLEDAAIVEVEAEIEVEKVVEIDPSMVQIKATPEELNRRIEAFMCRKREQANLVNLQEFCYHRDPYDENESSCARVSAILLRRKDSKSHVRVHRVVNAWGPQTDEQSTPSKPNSVSKETDYPPALEERLSASEKTLGVNKPVPRDIYARIKKIEDRLLELESISPEYKDFWSEEDSTTNSSNSIPKRAFPSSMDFYEAEERYAKKRC